MKFFRGSRIRTESFPPQLNRVLGELKSILTPKDLAIEHITW